MSLIIRFHCACIVHCVACVIISHLFRPTEEKVIYFLLLLRKENRPSLEDDLKAPALGNELIGM